MSNKLRTALKNGGRISILIDSWVDGSVHLQVVKNYESLNSVRKADLTANALNAEEDPDGLIRAEIAKLVTAAHISYEAREKGGANGN